ncbi:unnamed protein product [Lactuca virosa]|uniref:RING-type E3 ubiquitin transferase n=1 Tax=Lactuca virosa TaxID=75947 RepID=A0AAU9M4U1_9ASTR|nr:unnamed protein product [Lactuca virosa]
MMDEQPKRSSPKQSENGEKGNCVFSPGFRSVAAMAGWDEEALLMASLVVEDTPDRDAKQKRRSDPLFKTPPTNSRRKRRDQRKSPVSLPVAVLDLDEEEVSREEIVEEKKEQKILVDINSKKDEKSNESTSESSSIACIDRLREELSCAICLEICFEPSTTSCGHSFCKKCLRSAADKCGKKCPKCRQLISNGRSCTINTVLWNTIQPIPDGAAGDNSVSRRRRRREVVVVAPPEQDEDAALALRLQREEFMGAFGGSEQQGRRNSVATATVNLRAMASRAVGIRNHRGGGGGR